MMGTMRGMEMMMDPNPNPTEQRLLDFYVIRQVQFQRALVRQKYRKELFELTPEELTEILQETVLSAISEASEFLNAATNWKSWHPELAIDRTKAIEELIDLFKFVLNIVLYMSVGTAEFNTMFDQKTCIVWDRFYKEFPQATDSMGESENRG